MASSAQEPAHWRELPAFMVTVHSRTDDAINYVRAHMPTPTEVRMPNGTEFYALPRELWADKGPGFGCCCEFCSAEDRVMTDDGGWDTLVVQCEAGRWHAWHVHYPELHGAVSKRPKPTTQEITDE